ncbi:MAG: cupin domain-containing protein [Alphaproteobacteria bacterium]|nr:MAG: cupin domain-containing protein [Alphaproteobacteria bacterium]
MDRVEKTTREIGQRLRSARRHVGMTLSEVASSSGISDGFLSKLERGLVSVSIANLVQLADVLGLGMHELFSAEKTPERTQTVLYRAAEGGIPDVAANGYRWHHLGGGAPLDLMEVFYLVFPREKRMEVLVSHPGQEHCYVLSGEILFTVGEETHRLKAGDGIFISSEQPHSAENTGRGEAHVLMTTAKQPRSAAQPDWWQIDAAAASGMNETHKGHS